MALRAARVLVAGAGIVGVPLAYALKERLHGEVEITVVADDPEFHFIPANPWIGLGLRAAQDVSFALAPLLGARKVGLVTSALADIDLRGRRVRLEDGRYLDYEVLAIATGIRPNWNRLPGAESNPNVHSVIRTADALAAYQAYRQFVRRPGAVVIAAAAGVPTIGPMYEYAFLLDAELRRRSLRERATITLLTPEPYPGHVGLGHPVAREALVRALEAQKITWLGNVDLQGCEGQHLRYRLHMPGMEPQPQRLDFAYAMIWPPFFGVDAVARCRDLVDDDGLVQVDEYQRARGRQEVFALGACTAKPRLTETAVPVGAPDAVYVGQQQVAVVAANIDHTLSGEPLIRASIEREQWIADTGKRGAAQMAAPQVPLRDIQWLHKGQWVHEAKRDFENYYINQILFGAGPHGQVAALIRRLCSAARGSNQRSAARLPAHLPLNADLRRDLEALADALGVQSEALARQLLEKAVAEALSSLDPDTRGQMRTIVQAGLLRETEAGSERVRFEGGAP